MSVLSAYHRMIEPVREVARSLGYAVAVHGSLARDIDLIVVPWVDKCSSVGELTKAIKAVLENTFGYAAWKEPHPLGPEVGTPKPHGRLCWSILCAGTYVDLSIMPARYDLPSDETKPPICETITAPSETVSAKTETSLNPNETTTGIVAMDAKGAAVRVGDVVLSPKEAIRRTILAVDDEPGREGWLVTSLHLGKPDMWLTPIGGRLNPWIKVSCD